MAETFETRFWHGWFALINGFSLILATGMIAVGFTWRVLVALLVPANLRSSPDGSRGRRCHS